MNMLQAVFSVSLILFSVIDILGSLPVIIDLKRQGTHIAAGRATLIAGLLMFAFLFAGVSILGLFGIEVASFALAGSLIIFFIGLEMILGIRFFREEAQGGSGDIVPIAFPLVAGAGTLTTIISLKAKFDTVSISLGILVNLLIVFVVLRSSGWIGKKLGDSGAAALRKVFGIILIAIAFQMFKTYI
ncbi:MAG: MarC family protein [Bacteroidota bacterium]